HTRLTMFNSARVPLLSSPSSRYGHHRHLPSFPTRRSSDLTDDAVRASLVEQGLERAQRFRWDQIMGDLVCAYTRALDLVPPEALDRKSTRLNSSHQIISYAVFCLKKKNERKAERTATHALS